MNKMFLLLAIISEWLIVGCSYSRTDTDLTSKTQVIQTPVSNPPVVADPSSELSSYYNDVYGLSFQYPSNWFGPDEFISGLTLRVEVGSDKVYPYGTGLEERFYEFRNSYYVVVEYSKNDQSQYLKKIHQSLLNLKDGEEILSDGHGLLIRIGDFSVGEFTGIEYISTLPIEAQTEPIYTRHVLLFDTQSNMLNIMGTPNNVDFNMAGNWRDAYRMVDEANVDLFHEIARSISIKKDSP